MDLTVAQSASSLKPGAALRILLKSKIGVPQLAKKLNQEAGTEGGKAQLHFEEIVKSNIVIYVDLQT